MVKPPPVFHRLALVCSAIYVIIMPVSNADCLSVYEAVEYVKQVSPQSVAATYQVDQGEYRIRAIKAQKGPQVSAYLRSGVGDGALQTAQLDNQYGIQASYQLFDFGRSRAAIESAKSEVDATRARVVRTKKQVTKELLQVLIQVKLYRSLEELYQDRSAVLENRLERAKRQLENQTITVLDYSRINSDLSVAKYRLVDARNRSRRAELSLKNVLMSDTACVNVEELDIFIRSQKIVSPGDIETLVENSSEVREYDHQIKAVDFSRKSAGKRRWPEISTSAFSGQTYNEFTDRFEDRDRIGIQVTAPLYDHGAVSSEVGRLRARTRQLEAERLALEEQLRADIRSSWTTYQLLDESLSSLADAVASAENFLRATQTKYDLQAGTIDDVLMAEERLMDLKIRYLSSQADQIYTALSLLREDLFE